jgi:N-acetylgalactosamine-N,N'-diacetylbacillosaminyl-diphospho-undecaprenol 4-alpha-N-acetylgalactosaminyltransferase
LLLLEIFHKVSELDPNTKLIILGQGPLKKDIEKKIKQLNLEDRVFLFGLKNNIFKYLIHAKLFILTSSFEGFSNVILEAMALGIPVISNDCSAGPSEILGNTAKHLHTEDKFLLDQFGIRIPSDNFQEFVKAIIFMLTHADIMKKYEDLSRTRAKDFDIEKIIPQWRALIDLI